MFEVNTTITYSILLILSTEKGFEGLGRFINKTGKTISRWLRNKSEYDKEITGLAVKEFSNKKELVLTLDDTLIRKIYSCLMQGTGRFYDTKYFRRIMAYKLLVGMLTDGSISLPLSATLLFSKELMPNAKETKLEWIKRIIIKVIGLFPNSRIIAAADGAFATKEFLQWSADNGIFVEVRMRSNCSVVYKGNKTCIRDIKDLIPKGRKMSRTILVSWHGISLYITAQKRIDKHGEETIVFQASTFKAKSSKHVAIYRLRWNIEKMFRTMKQHLGLEECMSRKMEIQEAHISAVLLAYALLEIERKRQGLPSVEAAIRAAKRKKGKTLGRYIQRLDRVIGAIYV